MSKKTAVQSARPAAVPTGYANLLYMRAFAEAWQDAAIVQQLAGQLLWFHSVVLIARLKDYSSREWYARKTIAEGWLHSTLDAFKNGGKEGAYGSKT